MPDLLTHVLLAYSLGTALSWRFDWLSPHYVTVVMAGAFIPDIAKIALLFPSDRVAALLNIPFSWFAIHTAGGTVLAVLIGAVVVPPASRKRVAALLGLGAGSHLVADAFLLKAYGHSYPLLWPLTGWAPPTPGLYLSTDLWLAIASGLLALGVWLLDRSLSNPA